MYVSNNYGGAGESYVAYACNETQAICHILSGIMYTYYVQRGLGQPGWALLTPKGAHTVPKRIWIHSVCPIALCAQYDTV